ncbi:hypothetical protein Sjap_012886 [Stephania japonica]|uniref:Kinesin motor domain-containing protein n=1 Tax=Stephania japonica TaxID=461633 RepID=A0AAP0IX03_9MAGN
MERINVAVRPRPLSPDDAKSSPWRISANSISTTANQTSKFDFDRIFREDCSNEEVYEARTKDIVAAAVRGTVFAYGQTSSGKTHTMRGSACEPGVIPLADEDREFLLRMSYMEIYNEEINDLLAPEHRKLQIHESLERGIFVAGLKEEIVVTPEQVLDLMEFGESHRHIGETNMNVYSSRSHTIFRMIIESRDRTEDGDVGHSCDAVRVSVLNLVDLAGSERAAKTGAEGVRLKEGSHINKSLMTLGTVIKKLSEGAESQGGHVPYRDSKLTRILQPSLGGNANTAIICNITLAQILTDAALLKRQKKEIEELRARLQGSHAEHFEEEILNLRNTLLQSELERERIALELQEEKKAQALRERRLQQQAKQIENLSSMFLNSNVDEKRPISKKVAIKRRDTWCLGANSWGTLKEELSELDNHGLDFLINARVSRIPEKLMLWELPKKPERELGLLVPFEELANEEEVAMVDVLQDDCIPDKMCDNELLEDCVLPDACSLLNCGNLSYGLYVPQENKERIECHAENEDLLIEYQTQILTRDIKIEYLRNMLMECHSDERYTHSSSSQPSGCMFNVDESLTLSEPEVVLLIKSLREQIKLLEVEKFSNQENLNYAQELTARLGISGEKHEQVDGVGSTMNLVSEVETILAEVQSSRIAIDSMSSVVAELFQLFSADLKSYLCESANQRESILGDNKKLYYCLEKKVIELESDKTTLNNESIELHKQIEELRTNLQEADRILMECNQKQDIEKSELLLQIGNLQKEISSLSSLSLTKEKDTLRKELEKTKAKLKDTEFKLKNAVQDKTKLEGERAQAEREIKQLHGQKALLERDICKRDSLAGKRRESRVFDLSRAKAQSTHLEQIMQEEYKRLEVMAFEMEATISSLEEELVLANKEKEDSSFKIEILTSDLEDTSSKLDVVNSELKVLQEEVSRMRDKLDESASLCQKMENSVNSLSREKEELATQLTDALLELEEERAIWSAKERASIESLTKTANLSKAEFASLSEELLKMSRELDSCRKECEAVTEMLNLSEQNMEQEKKSSMEKTSEIDQLKFALKSFSSEHEDLKLKLEMKSLERCNACHKLTELQEQLCILVEEREHLSLQIKEMNPGLSHFNSFQDLSNQLLNMLKERHKFLGQNNIQQNIAIELEKARADVEELKRTNATMDVKMHNDTVNSINERAKFRMRQRNLQAKLDAFRGRYKESIDEKIFMNKRYVEATAKLKEQLASKGIEVLQLKKQLAAREV